MRRPSPRARAILASAALALASTALAACILTMRLPFSPPTLLPPPFSGRRYDIFSFQELLPHHARFVEKCFRGFDHFDETRADNGMLEYIRGFEKRSRRGSSRCQRRRRRCRECGS